MYREASFVRKKFLQIDEKNSCNVDYLKSGGGVAESSFFRLFFCRYSPGDIRRYFLKIVEK